MLVLFDLDDTLIETSKCLTIPVLKRAFSVFEEELCQGTLEELLALNERSLTAREAVENFGKIFMIEKKLIEQALETLYFPLSEEMEIEPVPGALGLLSLLEADHTLALVTRGQENLQLQKMKKAGIEPHRFSKLIVSSGESKKKDYQKVLEELEIKPAEAIVCGDRILLDLTPAKELGCTTVHFRNGRGKFQREPKESVDFTITTLKELQEVFANDQI